MARKSNSRLEKRREAEAAENVKTGKKVSAKKKTTRRKAAKRSRRSKSKEPQRKRLVWAVFSGSMKEEARFPYDQRDEAEKKLEQLRSKSKKTYFLQPLKEPISDSPAPAEPSKKRDEEAAEKKKPATKKKAKS